MEPHNHITVLQTEVRDSLSIIPNSAVIDATLGGFGHLKAITHKYKNKFNYIGIDYDKNSLEYFSKQNRERIETYNISLYNINFKDIAKIQTKTKISNIIFDLGISSYQLDNPLYGLTFKQEGPLNMILDTSSRTTALDIIHKYPKEKIKEILQKYTQEKYANKIANAIEKNKNKIKTTLDLSTIIEQVVPTYARKRHPSLKTFTALRMEVNQELQNLYQAIYGSVDILAPKGRILIITFHSTEDHLVKEIFHKLANPCTCPHNLPCICNQKPKIKIINKKPILPTNKEIQENPRSRSAQLRIIEKI